MPGRASAAVAGLVPRVERRRSGCESGERVVGLDQVGIVAVAASEVLAQEGEARVAGQPSCPITQAARIRRRPIVELAVQHRAGELGIVGPRASVDVVRPDLEPDVVDDARLGMDVDGSALTVLQVVHGDTWASGRLEALDDLLAGVPA